MAVGTATDRERVEKPAARATLPRRRRAIEVTLIIEKVVMDAFYLYSLNNRCTRDRKGRVSREQAVKPGCRAKFVFLLVVIYAEFALLG
jgi:hypothetical protein